MRLLNTLFFAGLASAAAKCYFKNGQESNGDVPCSNNQFSACCGSNAVCLSNGLCMDIAQPFVLSRGSCTDSSWGDDCPDVCTGSDWYSHGVSIVPLHVNSTTTTYCCNSLVVKDGNTTCANDGAEFTLDDAHVLTGFAALSKDSDSSSSSNSSSTDSSDSSSSSAASSDNDNNSKNVAIGVGVGVPLGVIALAAIGWAIFERRKRSLLASQIAQPQGMAAAYAVPHVPQQPVFYDNAAKPPAAPYARAPVEMETPQ